jgi:predicted acylesterase/phospholipase RssA
MHKLSLLLLLFFFSFLHTAFSSDSEGEEEATAENRKSPILIIAFNGGGIRGLLPATFLKHFEEQIEIDLSTPLNSKNHDASDIKTEDARINFAECVDIIAGTSTGGLIGIGLNVPNKHNTAPRYRARDLAQFYKDKGGMIFPQGGRLYTFKQFISSVATPKYDRRDLERELDKQFNLKQFGLGEAFSALMVPAYHANLGRLTVFQNEDRDHTFRDAALATSAAPYYFAAYKTEQQIYLDGGVVANNPALNTITHPLISEALKEGRPIYLLSIGTGREKHVTNYASFESMGGASLYRHFQEFLTLVMDGASQNTHEILEALHHNISGKFHYTPIEFDIDDGSLDNSSPQNLANFEATASHKFKTAFKTDERFQAFYAEVLKRTDKRALEARIARHHRKKVEGLWDLSCLPLSRTLFQEVPLDKIQRLYLSNTIRGGIAATEILSVLTDKANETLRQSLEVLDLSHNHLGSDFNQGKWLEGIKALSQLKVLLLHANQLTDKHCGRVTQVYSHWPVYYLDLSQNQISDSGLAALTEKLPSSLKLLNVARKDYKFTEPAKKTLYKFICVEEQNDQAFKEQFSMDGQVSILY